MSLAQRLLRRLYTLEAHRHGGRPMQAGALCWRMGESGIEVLLVNSRRSGKWGVPKGWSFRGRPLHKTAAREAWEEAGVIGRAENRLLGVVDAHKNYRLAGTVEWRLALYPLAVERLADEWPERWHRHRRWFPLAEAAEKVRPRALGPLLSAFAAAPVPPPSPAGPRRSSPDPAS